MESKRPDWWTELVPERDVNEPISIDQVISDNLVAICVTIPLYRGDARMTILLERDLDKWQGYEKQLNGN